MNQINIGWRNQFVPYIKMTLVLNEIGVETKFEENVILLNHLTMETQNNKR